MSAVNSVDHDDTTCPIMADKTTAFGVFMARAKFRYIIVVHKPPANAGNYTMAPNKVRN